MSLRRKGLVLAMESGVDVEVSGKHLHTLAMEAMEAVDEVEDAADDIEEIDDAVEDAVEDASTLDAIKDTMEDSLEEEGGMSESAAEIAEVSVESITARLGLANAGIPAMESFGSTSTRSTATRIAIESVNDGLKRVWEAIKNALANMWQKIKMFFAGMAKNAKAMDDYIQKLQERANKVSDNPDLVKDKLEKKGIAKAFSIEGNATETTVKTVIDNVTAILNASDNIVDGIVNPTKILSDVMSGLDANGDNATVMDKVTNNLNKLTTSILSSIDKVGSEVTEETVGDVDITTTKLGPYLNGDIYEVIIEKDRVAKSVKVGMVKKDGYETVAKDIPALDIAKIKTLLSEGRNISKLLVNLKKNQAKTDAALKGLNKIINEAIKLSETLVGDTDADIKTILNGTKASVQSMVSYSSKVTVAIPSMGMSTAKAVSSYAAASLDNLKKKDKA